MEINIQPDDLYQLNLMCNGRQENSVPVNAKYDRVDFYEPLGLYMLKLFDDEVGLMCVYVDKDAAMTAVAEAELPLVARDFIFQSEYEGYLNAQSAGLNDADFELDIDEASIIQDFSIEDIDE